MELFGGRAPEEVSSLLSLAMRAYADTALAENLLWQAQRQAPDALPVYFSLYKFYFYKRDLDKAEKAARLAMEVAATACGIDPDWRNLRPGSADWDAGAAHFFLFTLKALAFIRLRREDAAEAAAILAKISELDPRDSIGSSVISQIAQGANR